MELPIYQVDAFAGAVFRGNPASVCPLEHWLPDETMQAIAAENNQSETAFLVPAGDDYEIRWFTPAVEIDLAGHPTLAAAHVIFTILDPSRTEIRFQSRRSGALVVTRTERRLSMDFPSLPPERREGLGDVAAALGAEPVDVLAARDGVAVFETEQQVCALAPDMARVAALPVFGLIATAPGEACDFVSRFFAPGAGIPEDPVTGSAHCTLTPYWAKRLGKTALHARQVSRRGGDLYCRLNADRVEIAGEAVLYMEGRIHL